MSETPPQPPPPDRLAPLPDNPPPGDNFPPRANEPLRPPLKGWQALGIGVLLFFGSLILCFLTPFFALAGFIAAIASLFFKVYRHIFTGYIAITGVLLLIATIVCFVNPPDFK